MGNFWEAFKIKFKRSWQLYKTSWRVASHDKELMLLELFATLISFVCLGVIWGLLFGLGWDSSNAEPAFAPGLFYGIGSLATYLSFGAVFSYFRGAQMAGAMERMTGGDPTIGSALKKINPVKMQIVKWGFLTASVSFLLAVIRSLAKDSGARGAVNLATRIVGGVWDFITYLALPVVVFEGVGPFQAVRRSKKMLKETWGEQLIGGLVMGMFVFLFMLTAIVPIIIGAIVGGAIGATILGGLYVYVGLLFWSLVTAVYQTALYTFATTGKEPEAFAGTDFGTFFTEKKDKDKGKKKAQA